MMPLTREEVWHKTHKTGGASCMMDKKGPFNPYNFDIFKVIVEKVECNNLLLYCSTTYVFRMQFKDVVVLGP